MIPHSPLTFAYDRRLRPPPRRSVKFPGAPVVAVIASERLTMSLVFAADVRPIANTDRNSIAAEQAPRPHFVLVESCYHATSGWDYAQTTVQGRERLLEGLEPYRAAGVPLVYWFTRDVVHYENFREAIAEFDLVCVADPRVLERIRRDYPHKQALLCPPCVSPQLHNPFRWAASHAPAGPDIVFDGWAEIQDAPEAYEYLLAVPADRIDIVDSRYALNRSKITILPQAFQDRLRGCLSYAQMAWAARHYKVAIENAGSLSAPLSRLGRRLELLSGGVTISSCWQPDPEIADLVPAAILMRESPGACVDAAIEAADRELGADRQREAMQSIDRLWRDHGIAARLSNMCEATGIAPPGAERRYGAIFDGDGILEEDQHALANVYGRWPIDCLYNSNSIQALRRSVGRKFSDAKHLGSFRRAKSEAGTEIVLLARDRLPQESWLSQLAVAKSAACTGAALLLNPQAESTEALSSRYVTGSQLGDFAIEPLAMLIDAEILPDRPESADLADVLTAMANSGDASFVLVREGDFGGARAET